MCSSIQKNVPIQMHSVRRRSQPFRHNLGLGSNSSDRHPARRCLQALRPLLVEAQSGGQLPVVVLVGEPVVAALVGACY